jgi:hypothetical protein
VGVSRMVSGQVHDRDRGGHAGRAKARQREHRGRPKGASHSPAIVAGPRAAGQFERLERRSGVAGACASSRS